MSGPAAALREDLELVDDALEPFSAPVVNERSGLRWMQRTLQDRRAHIIDKIAEAERATLTVRLRTATGAPDIPTEVVAQALAAVQEVLQDVGGDVTWPEGIPGDRRVAALTLQVGSAGTAEEWWEIALHRPAGPLDAQPLEGGGKLTAFDAAVDRMQDVIDDRGADALRELATTRGISIELIARPTAGEQRTCAIDGRG